MGKTICAILFLVFCSPVVSQDYMRFKLLERENGLSDNTIEKILQDSKGFIWVGTSDGLNKYNGYNFEVFKKEKEHLTIPDNYILNITEDSKNRIWIATPSGIGLYSQRFNKFNAIRRTNVSSPSTVNFVFETRTGDILCGTDSGIEIYNPALNSFSLLTAADFTRHNINKNRIKCILQDRNNNIWIGTELSGIYLFDENFSFKNHFTRNNALRSNNINVMTADEYGNLWVGYFDRGIDIFDGTYHLLSSFIHDENDKKSISSNVIKCITAGKNHQMWIGTENGGFCIYDCIKNEFTRIEYNIETPQGLSQTTVSSIMEDQQGTLWIGTHRGGINYYADLVNSFHYFTQGFSNKSLSFKDVKSFEEVSSGDIFIATDGGGLNIWNRHKQNFSYFKHSLHNPYSISSNAVLSIFEDSDGNVWIGTWEGGLNKFHKSRNSFSSFKHDTNNLNSISSNDVWKIVQYSSEELLLGTSNGVDIFNIRTGDFKKLFINKSGNSFLRGKSINDIALDHQGNFWIATNDGGLNKYNPKSDYFTNYAIQISTIFIDSDGYLWVSGNAGLFKYNVVSQNFKKINFPGIHKYTISSILEDDEQNFWCGTQNGIIKINKKNGNILQYSSADGLQGMNFSRNASLKLKSGELLFGGYNGFNIFKPAEVDINKVPPKIYVTNFSVLNNPIYPSDMPKAILKQQILDSGFIVLNHTQSALFSFEFAALNFVSPDKNQYAYKLEGFDDDWNYIGNQNKITFTNLNPGKYTLTIRGTNNDNVWNNNGAVVKIHLLPPFWETWWFRLIIVLLLCTVVFIYFRMYRNLILRKIQADKQHEVHNTQLDFFTHISHELRTPLSLILGATEKLEETNKNIKNETYFQLLHRNVGRMVNLIKEIMDFRKVELGVISLQVEKNMFEKTIRQIASDFIPVAENKNITFTIDVSKGTTRVWFDKQFIERITLNLLDNAFKYTNERGNVSISILHNLDYFTPSFKEELVYKSGFQTGDYFYIHVKDNGVGISAQSLQHLFNRFYRVPNTRLGSGIGLAFVKSLTLLHKGLIYVYSEKNVGMEILVGIPYKSEDYTDSEKRDFSKIQTAALELPLTKTNTSDSETGFQKIEKEPAIIKKQTKILIVEDNLEFRDFLKSTFEESFEVIEAEDGAKGFQIALDAIPDLIITDIMMPVMDGIKMCEKIKLTESVNHIPIIMLTAKDSEESNVLGIESGADYYFSKPLSLNLLRTTIDNIFARSSKLKSHFLKNHQREIRNTIQNSKERELIETLLLIIDNEIDNPELNIQYICRNIGMSKTKLFNTVKATTGKSLNEFIRSTRLKKALHIMATEEINVIEAMNRVGIQSASYFTKAFKKEFGKTPSEYLRDLTGVSKKN